MDDMPKHIKEMRQKQNIPQIHETSWCYYFRQLLYPSQLMGHPPFTKKDKIGLGYDPKVDFKVYSVVITIGFSPSTSSSNSEKKANPCTSECQEELAPKSHNNHIQSPVCDALEHYDVNVVGSDDEDDFIVLQPGSQELEGVGRTVVDKLAGLNLGVPDGPRPILTNALTNEQQSAATLEGLK